MTIDTVDDLHAAEDEMGRLRATVGDALGMLQSVSARDQMLSYERRRTVAAHLATALEGKYCRPSCGANGDPDSTECTDESCGCPCDHTS